MSTGRKSGRPRKAASISVRVSARLAAMSQVVAWYDHTTVAGTLEEYALRGGIERRFDELPAEVRARAMTVMADAEAAHAASLSGGRA